MGYISAGIRKIAAIAIAIVASIKANLTKSRLRFAISIRALKFLIARRRSLRLVRIADRLRRLHQLGTLFQGRVNPLLFRGRFAVAAL